jgi:hypothetical protein
MGVVMHEVQWANAPIMEMLKALVEALESLPPSIGKEVESWNRVGRFIAGPLVMRYQQDSMVLPKLVERVKAMMRACERASASSLRESSERVWGEIDEIIKSGQESLTPHGVAWVALCRQIEASLITAFGEV